MLYEREDIWRCLGRGRAVVVCDLRGVVTRQSSAPFTLALRVIRDLLSRLEIYQDMHRERRIERKRKGQLVRGREGEGGVVEVVMSLGLG